MYGTRFILAFVFLALLAAGTLFAAALTAEHSRLAYDFGEAPVHVSLHGECRIGDGIPVAYDSTRADALPPTGTEPVVFTGHCRPAIPAGERVFVRVRHLRASIAVNGRELFSVGGEGTHPSFTHSPGNIWAMFRSPGISPDDTLTIRLQRLDAAVPPRPVQLFLAGIRFGSAWGLLGEELREVWWTFPIGIFFIALSVPLLMLALFFRSRHETKLVVQALLLAGMYFCGGIWEGINYGLLSLIFPLPLGVMTLEAFTVFFCGVFLKLYVATAVTGWRRRFVLTAALLCLALIVMTAALQLSSRVDLFVMQRYLYRIDMALFAGTLGCLLLEQRSGDRAARMAFLTFIPVCFMVILEVALYNAGYFNNGLLVSLGMLATALLQIALLVSTALTNMERAGRLERQLVESRIAVSLSQIRPHFLYNMLTGIQTLCSDEPAKAELALGDFVAFLRGNLDSLTNLVPIPLVRELEHVRHYLALERMRFGDRLRVIWRLTAADFTLPALSVQPLVENAVRWGMRESGVTVTIASEATDQAHVLTVTDDGRGFTLSDPHPSKHARGSGVALASIRTRLADMCGGSLSIVSEPGKGTRVTIRIPREKA